MKRGLETLLRLRRAERDAAAVAFASARAAHDDALARVQREEGRVRESQHALRAAAGEGRVGGWWSPARVGIVALAEGLVRADDAEHEAARALADAEVAAQGAERSLRALERLTDRIEGRERAARARTAQRRLEDVANGMRRSLLALAVLAGVGASGAMARAEEVDKAVVPLLADLQARHAELDRRERAVEDRERHAADLEKVAGARLAQAEEIAAAVEQRIAGWRAEQGDKAISRLSRIYAGMPPAKAAPLLERLDLDLATRIVAKMKPGQSAALLPFLSPERSLAMSWLVAHPLALQTGGDPSAAEPKP